VCFHPPEKPAPKANRPRRFGSGPHREDRTTRSYAAGYFTGNFAGYDATGNFAGNDATGNFAGYDATGYFAGCPGPAERGEKRRWRSRSTERGENRRW